MNASPDDDVLHGEFVTSFAKNVDFYHASYVARANHPYGICNPYSDYTTGADPYHHSIWVEDFLTFAFGYGSDLVGLSASGATKLAALMAWKYQSIVGRLGSAKRSSTTTTGFVGPTRYGPIDEEPDIVTSLADFERSYGDRQRLQFDALYADSAKHPRVLGIPLHPMITGQPLRIRYLERALAHIKKHPRVWFATGSEIIDAYERANPAS